VETVIEKPTLTLAEYVERVKHIKLDDWQIDLCARLEDAFRHPGKRETIAAPPQFGKTIIMSQAYPAYIFGQDPTHRFRLACYNILHAARFSVVVKRLLQSAEHKEIFRDPAGHIPERSKAVEWSTNARLEVNDGQASFIALGLQTGFVGTGADTLVIDDPYKSVEEALSPVIRDKTWRFYEETAQPRILETGNVFIMFHRYHQDDMGGRAIASGEFGLLRYAAQADGDYVDEESGRSFPDPLGREKGEYLSPRRTAVYYERQKKNAQVWNSQFQGRPTSEEGDFFNVSCLKEIDFDQVPKLLHRVRAWDNAATEGAGAYSVGLRMGIDSSANIYIEDCERKQVNTADRENLQKTTAERDGKLVAIHAPQDPGSAGKDVAYKFRQMLREYQVFTDPVSGSKEMRAYPYSVDFNKGKVFIVRNRDGSTPDWFKPFKSEHKNFPVGSTKDIIDAGSDGHKFLTDLFYRGLVIKSEPRLFGWMEFAERFGPRIPGHWEVSAAVRVDSDASNPSGWAITARAAEDAFLGECAFVVASGREYVDGPAKILEGLRRALQRFCEKGVEQAGFIWLSKGSSDIVQVAGEKYGLDLQYFEDDAEAGLPETNWYFQEIPNQRHPVYPRWKASHCYLLVDSLQLDAPFNDAGQLAMRQEAITWAYNDKGEPQPYGGVTLDCVRMMLYNFALSATALTREQRRISQLPDELKPVAVMSQRGTPEFPELLSGMQHALGRIEQEERKEEEKLVKQYGRMIGQPVSHRRYRRK
jgi:hypothetical protein